MQADTVIRLVQHRAVKFPALGIIALTSIARQFGTTVTSIVAINDLKNPNLIYVGEKLRVRVIKPAADKTYTVRRGDTLWEIAQRFGTTVPALVRLNRLKNPDLIYVGDVLRIP